MKLLRVRVSNYKNCCDDFTIDLVAKSKKTSEDKEYELQEIAEELGITKPAVHYAMKGALKKMRKSF